MITLATALWPGLAAATLLGLIVGFVIGLPRDLAGLCVALTLVVALAVLTGLAVSEQVPGDLGLRIETAALMLAVYLAGCVLGSMAKASGLGNS